jgi:hypothetical protein
MTRSHRSIHRVLWTFLSLLVAFGLTMALVLRSPPPPEAPQGIEGPKP